MERLATAEELSFFDIGQAFWRIKMKAEDKEKTAFTTPSHGLLQFTVMPFGLTNSGATWQKAAEGLLERDPQGTLLHKRLEVYSTLS